ncbi:IQ and AAA domain-containing protein 1 [Dufourea novaeangliae]|uniref:IQ and AAA domain-containing protein 1 n=1 Tax=Dufourea novaeangliae TaxID=178035 RepID=A0A154PKC8_DUFNO|nr:IQ and AAA domain-containing protein 1 [Dufourea novaeangliae]
MSHNYYNELWLITRNDLEKLLTLDRRVQEQPDTKNREHGLNLILPTYLRYRNLVKRLIVCHDQMVQTQKRDLIKRVLDCAVGRMLDYKKRIVDLDFTDYQWPDDFMKQLKYTPDDVEITVSAAGKDVVQYRRKRIVQLMENAPETDMEEHTTETEVLTVAESEESAAKFRKRRVKEESAIKVQQSILHVPSEVLAAREARLAAEETMRKAILLIQSHERARMARITGIELERTNAYRRRVETGEIVPKMFSKATYEKAARTIQRAWWTYLRKKAQRKRMGRFEELIGMSIPSWKSDRVLAKDRENFQKKLESMPVCAEHVAKATEDHRTKLWKVKGPGLMEDITDEIREWFVIWYNETGHFDVYPAASLGGTVLVATGQTLTPQEFLAQKVKAKDAKEEPKKGGKGERKKRKRKKPWMPETKAFTLLDEANRDFIGNWSFRRDTDDTGEMIYGDLIKDKLCYELQLEMREIVDELMRLELKKLNQALKKDCKANNKHIDIPKSKGGRKKKKKGRKGKKRDLLGNATVEDIFSELVHANIIEDYPLTSLKGWVGDLSYENYEAAREFRDHRHRLGEIKQVVMENCILPLSSKEIHQIAPMVRSVCICGLPRHGKTFLVNAICSEVGALLINMTPSVLVDKYVGRKNERKLIDMISKVARELAPSVIFIDNSEKLWAKKVPAEERVNKPKRFAKYYPKFVKSIKRGDQILFLTTSSEPYKATRPFVRVHDKFIMIPLTDYNTLYMFYKDLLMRYHGVDRDIDVSCLAKMSEGIPLEFIKQAIENVLNVRRRITLRFEPLNPREIMEEVMKHEPFSKKTLSQFAKFESRTPIATKRARMLMALKAEREKQEQSKKTKK